MKGGIYAIQRIDGGRLYIGSAVYIERRWAVHRCRLRKGSHHSPQLQNAWNKHGESAFEFVVLERVSDHSRLIEREQVWLDAFAPFYNTCKVAGSVLGHSVSPEARAKISAAHKGRRNGPPSAEVRAKIADALRGRPLSAEHRAKLAAAKLGRKRGSYSDQHKANIAAGLLRRYEEKRA